MNLFGSQRRRRKRAGDPVLPVTASPSPSSPAFSSSRFTSPHQTPQGAHHSSYQPSSSHYTTTPSPIVASNPCNSFLLGGNYYPGKDKKRRVMMRRKTLWFRIFCSSPGRMGLTALVVAYISIWHVLVPFVTVLWTYAIGASGGSDTLLRGNDLLDSQSPLFRHLPSWKQALDAAHELSAAREQLANQPTWRGERLHLLERIDPVFFHRNDHPKQQQQQTVGNDGESPKEADPDPDRTADGHVPRRTLQNMDTVTVANHCPRNSHEHDTEIQTTLVTQASLNRIRVLQETCRRWKDPIVAVLAMSAAEQQQHSMNTMEKEWKQDCPQLHLIPYILNKGDKEQDPEHYPVNKLRNIGLDAVETSHVLVCDVDFVPSDRLHETIRSVILERAQLRQHQQHEHLGSDEMEAVVVPAFQRNLSPPCSTDEECMQPLLHNSSFIPRTFDELLSCHTAGDCIVFQSDVNPAGHSSTRSEGWLKKQWYDPTETLELEHKSSNGKRRTVLRSPVPIECFDTARYEPYVVIRWCPMDQQPEPKPLAPYYDERFHGYGKNKIELVQHLRMMGYRFSVLPEGFLVHNPHVESKVKQRWNQVEESDLHRNMDLLYREFLGELFDRYQAEVEGGAIVGLCSNEHQHHHHQKHQKQL